MERAMDARGVVEDHLPAFAREDADQAVAGGLRFIGDDRHLLSQEVVHEGRLAGVRPADQGHGARAGRAQWTQCPPPAAASGSWMRSTRTFSIRRSAAAST